ncbi:MAG: translation initiation factor eIF-1A [Candidatus Hodarchaeales archaeon]|jgi:translation initiation factor 1A
MEEQIRRVRLPRKGELMGVVTAMLGAGRVRADCEDGKERMGRIRGKILKRIWIRAGDLILLKPWDIEYDKKADVIWRYTKTEANWLKRKGYVKNLNF